MDGSQSVWMWSPPSRSLREMKQVIEAWNLELDHRFAQLASWQLEQELRKERQRCVRNDRTTAIRVWSAPEDKRPRA